MLLEFYDLVAGRELDRDASVKGVVTYDSGPRLLSATLQPGGNINVSWGARACPGAYVDIQLSVEANKQWSPWFTVGRWTEETNVRRLKRTSFSDQSAVFGKMDVDTYRNPGTYVTGWRIRANCYGPSELFWMTVQVADRKRFLHGSLPLTGAPTHLDVPVISQYSIRGGKVHCGPASAHGILSGYGVASDAGVAGAREVIRGTVDRDYLGGNWAFMAAYMSAKLRSIGKRAFIQNVSSLRDIEMYLQDGYPVIASLAWDNTSRFTSDHLRGGIQKTDGHLLVVVGTKGSRVLVMDPATTRRDRSDVARSYLRKAFERQLINSSNGTIIAVSELPV